MHECRQNHYKLLFCIEVPHSASMRFVTEYNMLRIILNERQYKIT